MIDQITELGYTGTTVAQVVGRAGVSRKTFYSLFTDLEDCMASALEIVLERLSKVAREAYARERDWLGGIRAALIELLLLADEEPGIARLLLIETLSAGARVLSRRRAVLAELASAIDRGRGYTKSRHQPTEIVSEGIVGGIVEILVARILARRPERLSDLAGPLMSMIVLPYLGAGVARRELSRERPAPRPPCDRAPERGKVADPLAGLNIRVTYRTVLVLTAIGERPGVSNREVGERAGIVDQGQISKLLARLESHGLTENRGEGQDRGAANEWHLTPHGAQIEHAARLAAQIGQ